MACQTIRFMIHSFIFFLIFLWTAVVALFYGGQFFDVSKIFEKQLPVPAEVLREVTEPITKREVISPTPLRIEREAVPDAVLSRAGIITLTNIQRAARGLVTLTENTKLNSAAKAKVDDMFARQYFAHVSPQGIEAGGLAERAGYKFIRIGENLAMGNFVNDQELIQGWMDSPGHRANILNKGFQEIGVAAAKGLFEGKVVWLAVQIFGLPQSACPQPNMELKINIERYNVELNEFRLKIEALRAEVESLKNEPKEQYNEMVEQYNALVGQYNGLVVEMKTLVDIYNRQVRESNLCMEEKLR